MKRARSDTPLYLDIKAKVDKWQHSPDCRCLLHLPLLRAHEHLAEPCEEDLDTHAHYARQAHVLIERCLERSRRLALFYALWKVLGSRHLARYCLCLQKK